MKGGGRSPLRTLAVVLAVLGAAVVVQLVWGGMASPDPHYVAARRMVADYELGKPEELRNYDDPVYDRALAELELVDPDSISAKPAAEMAADIKARVAAFHARLAAEARRAALLRSKRQQRQRAFFEAQARARLNPVTSYPECEEGNKTPHHR